MQLGKWLILVVISILLTACGQRDELKALFQNHETLRANLSQCNSGQLAKDSNVCLNTFAVSKVLAEYFALQRQQGQRYVVAQRALDQLDARLQLAASKSARAHILESERKTLGQYDQVFFAVQENFAKLIMAQESRYSQLKQRYAALEKQLDNKPSGELKQQLKQVEQQLVVADRLVQAMMVFVDISGAG